MTVLDACLFEMGHPEQATHMKHVLALYEALGDRLGVAATLSNLGATAYFESRWHDAADAWAKAFDAALQAGDTALSAMTHANLAELRINQGRLEEAETLVTPARRTLESFGFMGNIAFAVLQLGRVRAFLGRVPDGVGLIDRAVAMYEDIGSQAGALEGRARLAEVQTFARDVSAAARALDHARADARGLGETHLEVLLDRVSVTLATVEGDETRAQKELEPALAHARDARADYDVLMLLTLADRLGTHNGIDERAELADRLGVVTLAVLP